MSDRCVRESRGQERKGSAPARERRRKTGTWAPAEGLEASEARGQSEKRKPEYPPDGRVVGGAEPRTRTERFGDGARATSQDWNVGSGGGTRTVRGEGPQRNRKPEQPLDDRAV